MTAVRIGLLGCGSIGGFLARHVLAEGAADSIELSYVHDVDEKRLETIPPSCRVTEQAGKVTGAHTPQSALGPLRRICRGSGGVRFV